jgi:methionyl-tRNA synthetase
MQGFDPVVLTTGSDEHGQNVERAAKAAGNDARQYTTDRRTNSAAVGQARHRYTTISSALPTRKHHETVRWLFERCQANGYVYKGSYTGQYCVSTNCTSTTPSPAIPARLRPPTETVTEENYFFKLSAFQGRLLEHYEKTIPISFKPDHRRNE